MQERTKFARFYCMKWQISRVFLFIFCSALYCYNKKSTKIRQYFLYLSCITNLTLCFFSYGKAQQRKLSSSSNKNSISLRIIYNFMEIICNSPVLVLQILVKNLSSIDDGEIQINLHSSARSESCELTIINS